MDVVIIVILLGFSWHPTNYQQAKKSDEKKDEKSQGRKFLVAKLFAYILTMFFFINWSGRPKQIALIVNLGMLELEMAIRIRNPLNICTQNPNPQFKMRIRILNFYDFCSTYIFFVFRKQKKYFIVS